jgi:uncharacterized membrane protein
VLSFIYLGIYWNNHHHLLKACRRVNAGIMWANLYLLFWLSLFPFVTGWMGENHFTTWTVAVYGVVLIMAAVAYYLLVRVLKSSHGEDSTLARAIGTDFKGKISVVIYAAGIALAFVAPFLAVALYALVATIWLVPDRRIEKNLVE